MNILHGDAAAKPFKHAFEVKSDAILIFHDLLSCGPLGKFTDLESWVKFRGSFWNKVSTDNCADMSTFTSLHRDFYHFFKEMETAPEYRLWIGTGLSDQLLLCFIVHLFEKFGLALDKLSIIQFEKTAGKQGNSFPVQGLGLLKPDQIKDYPQPYSLSSQQIKRAKLAWEAVTDSDPQKYIQFMSDNDESMPLLQEAMSYLFFRYPRAKNGLSCWDERLLKHTLAHAPDTLKVLGFTLVDPWDGLDLVGDSYLFSRLKNLAAPHPGNPLIKMNSLSCPMRETTVEITEFGRSVLEDKVNAVKENGINDWVGGVHLDSNNNGIWVRAENELFYQKLP